MDDFLYLETPLMNVSSQQEWKIFIFMKFSLIIKKIKIEK